GNFKKLDLTIVRPGSRGFSSFFRPRMRPMFGGAHAALLMVAPLATGGDQFVESYISHHPDEAVCMYSSGCVLNGKTYWHSTGETTPWGGRVLETNSATDQWCRAGMAMGCGER